MQKNYLTLISDSELILNDEEQKEFSINRFSVMLKMDLDLKAQDEQVNQPDDQDLDDKMRALQSSTYVFKGRPVGQAKMLINLQNEYKTFRKPKQPQSSSRLSLDLSSNRSDSQKTPSNLEPRRPQKGNTVTTPRGHAIAEAISPSFNRYECRKRSHFSNQPCSSQEVPIESNFQLCQRRERSINVTTTVQTRSLDPHLHSNGDMRMMRQVKHQQQRQILQEQELQIVKRNSQSSSISTPKSILKTPSHGSSQIELRINSRPSISSCTINLSPNKQETKKRVKFCLTRNQARRENIIC